MKISDEKITEIKKRTFCSSLRRGGYSVIDEFKYLDFSSENPSDEEIVLIASKTYMGFGYIPMPYDLFKIPFLYLTKAKENDAKKDHPIFGFTYSANANQLRSRALVETAYCLYDIKTVNQNVIRF